MSGEVGIRRGVHERYGFDLLGMKSSRSLARSLIGLVFLALVVHARCEQQLSVEGATVETFNILNVPTDELSTADLILDNLVEREFENKPKVGFSRLTPLEKVFILNDDPEVGIVTVVFRPERQFETIDDYEISFVIGNEEVLAQEDIDFTVEQEVVPASPDPEVAQINAYNITVDLTFNRKLGQTDFEIVASQRFPVGPEGTPAQVFRSKTVDLFVSGIQVYRVDDPDVIISDDSINYQDLIDLAEPKAIYGFLVVTPDRVSNLVERVSLDDMVLLVSDSNRIVDYGQGPTGSCQANDGTWNGETVEFVPNCHVTTTDNLLDGEWPRSYLGFLINKFRTGTVEVTFSWPTFGEGIIDPSEDQRAFSTFTLIIAGTAPPVVTAIAPAGPFRTGGGELVTVVFFNGPDFGAETESRVQFLLTLRQSDKDFVAEPGTYERDAITGVQSIQLRTPSAPQTGPLVNLEWEFSVNELDELKVVAFDDTDGYLFSYFAKPIILRLEPDTAEFSSDPATLITIVGEFPGVVMDDTLVDAVLFNGEPVREPLPVINDDKTQIVFELPPRPGNNFEYPVVVRAGAFETDPVTFTYIVPALVRIVPLDGQNITDADDIAKYTATTQDDNRFRLELLVGNFEGAAYAWALRDQEGNPISLDNANNPGLTVPGSTFTSSNVFFLTVVVTTADGSEASDEIELVSVDDYRLVVVMPAPLPVKRRDGEFVEVVVQVSDTGLDPNVDYEYNYRWTFQGQEYEWNVNSPNSPESETSVNKFGRNFKVLLLDMQPGTTTDISVEVTVRGGGVDQTTVARAPVVILPRELFAVIGNGAAGSEINSNEEFFLTGENSIDDSIIPSDNLPLNDGLEYEWTECQYSSNENLANALDCKDIIIGDNADDQSFTVPASSWSQIKLGSGNVITYVRLGLKVTKDGAEDVTRLTYELRDNPFPFATIDSFSFTDAEGNDVPQLAVNYLSTLIIQPRVTGGLPPGAVFVYSVRATDFDSSDFLKLPGSYQVPGERDAAVALAIRGGSMDPARSYTVDLEFSANNQDNAQYRVTFRTIERPTFTVKPFNTKTGNARTRFDVGVTSTAGSGFFKVLFRLFDANDLDTPLICVGGCNGVTDATFFICREGSYRVQAQIVDITTSFIYDSSFSPPLAEDPLTITADIASTLDLIGERLDSCTTAGDDSCLLMTSYCLSTLSRERAISASRQLLDVEGSEREANETRVTDVAIRQDEDEEIVNLVRISSEKLEKFTGTSVLNTYSMATLSRTFAGYARGREATIADIQTVEQLLAGLYQMIQRSAAGTSFTFTDTTLEFLYDIGDVSAKIGQEGSSRRRLLQDSSTVNQLVLDTDAVGSIVIPTMDVSKAGCGSTTTSATEYAGSAESAYGPTQWFSKVICNRDQLDSDVFQVDGSSMVVICEELATTGFRTALTFQSLPDVVALSGVRTENITDTPGLVKILTPLPITPPGEAPKELPDRCFRVTTSLIPQEGDEADAATLPTIYLDPKTYPSDPVVKDDAYLPSSEGVFGVDCTDDQGNCDINEPYVYETSRLGLFGVQILRAIPVPPTESDGTVPIETETEDGGGGLSAGGIVGIVLGAFFLLLLILALCLLYFLLAPPLVDDDDEEPAWEYVERDIYGRGFVIEQSAASDMISGLLQSGTLSGTVSGTLSGTL